MGSLGEFLVESGKGEAEAEGEFEVGGVVGGELMGAGEGENLRLGLLGRQRVGFDPQGSEVAQEIRRVLRDESLGTFKDQ